MLLANLFVHFPMQPLTVHTTVKLSLALGATFLGICRRASSAGLFDDTNRSKNKSVASQFGWIVRLREFNAIVWEVQRFADIVRQRFHRSNDPFPIRLSVHDE